MANPRGAQAGVEAVDRAMSILRAFDFGGQPLTLSQLCQRTGLHKSTVLRLGASLERTGMLHRLPEKRYQLGPTVVQLARIFNSMVTLPEAARGPMRQLMERTKLSVSLYMRQGEARLCVARADPPEMLRDSVEIGDLRPLDNTATGLAFRRFQDAAPADAPVTPIYTIGIYNPDMSSMAYPVFGVDNRLAAVLTLSGHRPQFDRLSSELLAEEMAVTAKAIEEAVGRF